jgi:hypothetical protein
MQKATLLFKKGISTVQHHLVEMQLQPVIIKRGLELKANASRPGTKDKDEKFLRLRSLDFVVGRRLL